MTIGRREQGQRQRWDGIECGAIVLSTEIFDTLAALWNRRRRYFTLADALDIMAGKSDWLGFGLVWLWVGLAWFGLV